MTVFIPVVGAVALHFWFRNNEPKTAKDAIHVLLPYTSLLLAITFYLVESASLLLTFSVFYLSLLASILLYRTSPFHPLAKYPGPFACKCSKLWTVWKSWDGKLPRYYKRLHDSYGPIVRIGPNEISIVQQELLPEILGSNGIPKGPLWDGRKIAASSSKRKDIGDYNLIGNRDTVRHTYLRKQWNKAFASEPMRDYTDLLVRRVTELMDKLELLAENGMDVDVSKWISYFSFDFMGDLMFGESFDLMKYGDQNSLWKTMEDGLFLPSKTMHIPWSATALGSFPGVSTKMRKFALFALELVKIRASKDLEQKDLFYHLASNFNNDSEKSNLIPIMTSNIALAIVAGSDTSASALTSALFFLLTHRRELELLSKELDEAFPSLKEDVTHLDASKLDNLPRLNATINETLRLHPPVPTSMQRAPTTKTGGKMIGPHFIAEGTAVTISAYSYHRDPRYFYPDPNDFWPDRWLLPNVVLERKAFIPFSTGPANCVGKTLALTELRYSLALIIGRFDINFASNWDPASFERSLEDHLTLSKGPLMVNFRLREK